MNQREDHSRVAIWTDRVSTDDMLLTESRIFLCRRDRIDHSGLAARAKKLIGNMSCFVLLSDGLGLGIRCNKECLQSGKHDPSRIAVWFVAAGVLTAGVLTARMMM